MSSNFVQKFFNRKQLIVLVLGFASGLPLALTGTAMQAWLTTEGLDIKTIGFFTLVGMPYTFKFLWAPLMDRFELPFFGRRKGWIILTQILLALALFSISLFSPTSSQQLFALMAIVIAFLSASQDVVIDAYRTDILDSSEKGLGSSVAVFGFRLAMILSGGIAFVWADTQAGNGWSWPKIYSIMGIIMLALALFSFIFLPKIKNVNHHASSKAKNELLGFLAVVVAVAIGYELTSLTQDFLQQMFNPEKSADIKKWTDMISLLLGIGFTLPLAWFAAQKAKFETLNTSLKNYFSMKGAYAFLALIILYKLGDSFAGALLTNFLIKGVGYSTAEIGVVNKVLGIWLTIVGTIIGGSIMIKLGLFRSLFIFGILQMFSNLGFWLVAVTERGSWGSFTLPAFDILIVTLKESTQVDWLLLLAVATENLTGGMGTAAFVAFLMALCNQKFTATQYALLSAFAAVGRVWVGPLAGVLVDSIGWPKFFVFATCAAIPGLILIYKMKPAIIGLETPQDIGLVDD